MRPAMDRKMSTKIDKERSTSKNSSSSTQNASNRFTRVINKAVSTILPSSSHKKSPKSTNNTPPPGLSSILSKQHLAPQSNSSPKRITQIRENQISAPNPNPRVNPILRTNLLTNTPTFKDAGVISTQLANNSRNKRCPPVLHNNNNNDKGKKVISTRYSNNSVNSPKVISKWVVKGSVPNLPNSDNSHNKVSKNSPTQVKGNPNFSTKSLSLKDGVNPKSDTISTNKPLVKTPISDPKGKGIIDASTPTQLDKKVLNNKSKYKSYEDWFRDHYISTSDNDLLLLEPVPVGERCQMCAMDLAFLSSSDAKLDPPVVAVLSCGHASHVVCLEKVYGSQEPSCFSCIKENYPGKM